jgi:hypothetical protein
MEMDIVMNNTPQNDPTGSDNSESKAGKGRAYYLENNSALLNGTPQLLTQSGWYYGNFTSEDAQRLLQKEPVGTFIVRDSSDVRCHYSLSFRTCRETNNIRIHYCNGTFHLDSVEQNCAKLQRWDNVVLLVDYLARVTQAARSVVAGRFVERSGDYGIPISLQKPKLNRVLDLKHMCRLSINRSLPETDSKATVQNNMDKLPLPRLMKDYMKEYPYLH